MTPSIVVLGEDVSPALPVGLGAAGLITGALAVFLIATTPTPAAAAEAAPALTMTKTADTPLTAPTSPAVSNIPSQPKACAPIVVPFAFGSSAVDRSELPRLDALGSWLAEPAHGQASVLIHGHADALGTDDANLALSKARSQVIAARLGDSGVARGRITSRGFGAYQPVEGAPEEAASNRRVVVYIKNTTECPPQGVKTPH